MEGESAGCLAPILRVVKRHGSRDSKVLKGCPEPLQVKNGIPPSGTLPAASGIIPTGVALVASGIAPTGIALVANFIAPTGVGLVANGIAPTGTRPAASAAIATGAALVAGTGRVPTVYGAGSAARTAGAVPAAKKFELPYQI